MKKIKAERLKAGLGTDSAAVLIGISGPYLNQLENGRRPLYVGMKHRIYKAYDDFASFSEELSSKYEDLRVSFVVRKSKPR